jgi:peptidoglycan/xylan/chitin deacetylase (PgdA/CDA1 family)
VKFTASVFVATFLLYPVTSTALVILQYHHVSDITPAITSTSPALFSEHMQTIKKMNYSVLSLDEVQKMIRQKTVLPDKAVLITFDDSYSSVFTQAFPILKQKQFPFTLFANTKALDQKIKGFLNWEQVRIMSAHGASIANHSVSHSHLARKLTPDNELLWRSLTLREIDDAENRIREETGHHYKVFSYPYGEYNIELQALLEQQGYLAMGQHSGAVGFGQLTDIPRYPMGGEYGNLRDFKTKLVSRPLPFKAITVRSDDGKVLKDGLLPAELATPIVEFSLDNPALIQSLRCFVSQQGASHKDTVSASLVRFKAKKPLTSGRTRFNCSAPSDEPNRFYWYSIPFIKRNIDGTWPSEN